MKKHFLAIVLPLLLISVKAIAQDAKFLVAQRTVDTAFDNYQHGNYSQAIKLYKKAIAERQDTYYMELLALCYAKTDSVKQEKSILELAANMPVKNGLDKSAECCGKLADLYLKEKNYQKALLYYNLYGEKMKHSRMPDRNMLAYNLYKENARSKCFEGLKVIDSAADILTPYVFCTYKDVRDINGSYTKTQNTADSLRHDSICARYLSLLEKLHSKRNIKAELKKADSGFYYSEKLTYRQNDWAEKDVICGFTFYGTDIIYTGFGVGDTFRLLMEDTKDQCYTLEYQLQGFRRLPICRMIQALPDED